MTKNNHSSFGIILCYSILWQKETYNWPAEPQPLAVMTTSRGLGAREQGSFCPPCRRPRALHAAHPDVRAKQLPPPHQ